MYPTFETPRKTHKKIYVCKLSLPIIPARSQSEGEQIIAYDAHRDCQSLGGQTEELANIIATEKRPW